ncbi:MAG TPA: F0F1 ATP synthase subunit B [Gaiellaceae bacterium]|jgi:F-type H+-transporting ATPase subunit b|nr:F0F1 ATP synthase subunit B [Gaiellaceae bacterium]
MTLLADNGLIKVVPGLMIWTLITFGLVFLVLRKVAFGRIQEVIDARRERIRLAIDEADNARAEARKLLEEHRALVGQARTDAEGILAEARRVAESQRERVREETEVDRKRRLEETRRQVEAETRRALEEIRAEVADLTLLAATKVTGKSLSGADHKRLIEDAIAELDFSAFERGGPVGSTEVQGQT